MDIDFEKVMSQRTDAELIEIVTKKSEDYQQAALLAAEAELKKRNLSSEETEIANSEIEKKEKTILENSNAPLGIGWKLLTFFLPGIPNFLIARVLKAEGYDRKWREAWHWTFYGIMFYVGLVVLAFIFISMKNSI